MTARYVPYKDLLDDREIAIHFMPSGVVALDVDAPTEFYNGEDTGRLAMVKAVQELAAALSRKHGLGLWWLYETGNGLHIIFQAQLHSFKAVEAVLKTAYNLPAWHECGGHAGICQDVQACVLRVGCKPNRPFDLRPWYTNPPTSHMPAWVREHEEMLAQQLPAK